MKKLYLLTALSVGFILSGCSNEWDISDSTCSIPHINEVAQKEGLEKARALTEACVKGGYEGLAQQVDKAHDAAKETYNDTKNVVTEKLQSAQETINEKSEEWKEKAENIKKEIQR